MSKDVNKEAYTIYTESMTGLNYNDIKNWFVNRYLYSAHPGALNQFQLENFLLAKRCFSVLDETFNFSKVNASTNEIMVNTPNGEIYYEYLSSGFKSCLAILFGIIKEIEYRFINPYIKAEDFDGIILIDEIELHLHPLWQSKFPSALLEIFPNAQFIVTTHSPHVVQFAQRNQIIALEYIGKSISIRLQDENKYGYQGWTIEEILEDVMGMNDNRTIIFNQMINEFEKSLDDEDITKAKEIFTELDSLLHPNNHLRKLLKFQIARIKE